MVEETQDVPAVPARYEATEVALEVALTIDGQEIHDLTFPVTVTVTGEMPENPVVLHYHGSTLVSTHPVAVMNDTQGTFTTNCLSTFVLAGDTQEPSARKRTMSESDRMTYAFWNEVIAQINKAEAGSTLSVKTEYYVLNMPVRVIDALRAADDVTLKIEHRGSTILLDEVKPYEANRIHYPMEVLEALYK